ncbi:efflux RND transporter periplasmic adaptor subunit [Vibrio nigripulchritudo]|uniref:efflux RND transporter periplasmic adaptor subunit n=1 Tax=Vibrio nigripulchritudo TaxID=28173 RepID=UPI0003B18FF8|nr:efflux RND transporter periplasmic adaptor subunit [Vibrio nigripulchritudo]CCN70623.1 putative Secretion protein HlyD [Vibrio nigripulchritudo SFn118]
MKIGKSLLVATALSGVSIQISALELLGQVQLIDPVHLVSQVSGVLEKVDGQVGESVKSGSKLTTIQAFDYELAVKKQAANLALAKADMNIKQSIYQRYQTLKKKKSLSQNELDVAKADMDSARATVELARIQLAEAKNNLEDTVIVSTIDGIITQRHVESGTWVERGTPLFQLANIDTVRIRFFASQYDLDELRIGMPVELWLEGSRDEKVTARIERIGIQPDDQSKSYPVFVSIDNIAHVYRPGMTVYASTQSSSVKGE